MKRTTKTILVTKIINVQLIARGKYEAEQLEVRRAIAAEPSRRHFAWGGSTYLTVAGNLHHIDVVYEKYLTVVQKSQARLHLI